MAAYINQVKDRAMEMADNAHELHPDNTPAGETEWTGSIFNCGGIAQCIGACFCGPCLYGRAADRLRSFPKKPEETGFSYLNGDCLLIYLAGCFGLSCVPVYLQRRKLRERFHLKGDLVTDWFFSCCCACCAIAQHNHDLKTRSDEAHPLMEKDPAAAGYGARPAGMDYKAPVAADPVSAPHHEHNAAGAPSTPPSAPTPLPPAAQ